YNTIKASLGGQHKAQDNHKNSPGRAKEYEKNVREFIWVQQTLNTNEAALPVLSVLLWRLPEAR
ncbi:MAG: hypothetical protein ACLU61_05830, partial [Lachnospiraceae bacterium]